MENKPIMKVENLTKVFTSGIIAGEKTVAVKDVTFNMNQGEVISLIGESGSGKTTIGRIILKLLKPTEGKLIYNGQDITHINSRHEKKDYYKKVQAIFQDPFSSFNPLFRIDRIFNMVFASFMKGVKNRRELIEQSLESVNLNPQRILNKFPHQLSGGQLQRLLIARALLLNVDILIADELISMLDASTRIGVLNLLVELCKKNGMTVLFITHDLNLGYYISDTTLIMYKGRLVERGDTEKIYKNPVHPYTKMLFESIPEIGNKWDKEETFLPETVIQDVKTFYRENEGEGFKEVEANHKVLFSE
ncbi:MAG TPA: ABC transporter ATP-binding protein [Thermotogota bacterium]|nr:ABC transporter ATP-binding protein [Thermotogota bacterium]HRW34986.1 ABC transporter ATP-binding protein [Thermotogota bacterium]